MFIDSRSLPKGSTVEADLCIVGCGAAGLAIADRLASSGLKIVVVESGGMKLESDVQALNEGESNHADYPFLGSRARAFGGTTKRWTGACILLDPSDFERRDWINYSGWPIGPAALEPYRSAAASVLGPSAALCFDEPPLPPWTAPGVTSKVVRFAEPLDLSVRYRPVLERSRTITVMLHGTVSSLNFDATQSRIRGVDVRCPGGNRLSVAARQFVLAAGGIENPRLMLSSGNLPKALPALGRYYMEHPIKAVGVLPVGNRHRSFIGYTNQARIAGRPGLWTFGLSPEVRRRHRLLDLHVRLYRYHPLEDADFVTVGKRLTSPPKGISAGWFKQLRDLAVHTPEISRYLAWHWWNKLNREAVFPAVRMMAFVEQEPNPTNRITLSGQRDRFDMPLPHLHFSESDFMKHSIDKSMHLLAQSFSSVGLSRLRHGHSVDHLSHYENYGLHHMGSTRMSESDRDGVVDRNCRVHGVANLFVAGSSVFPTGGAGNPTLTIVLLALRLADHMRDELQTAR